MWHIVVFFPTNESAMTSRILLFFIFMLTFEENRFLFRNFNFGASYLENSNLELISRQWHRGFW